MAHSASAKKRIRQNEKRRLRNRRRMESIKTVIRDFNDKVHAGDTDGAAEALKAAYKRIDQVAAKGTLHKNTAARRKSFLAKQLHAASSK